MAAAHGAIQGRGARIDKSARGRSTITPSIGADATPASTGS